MHASMWYGMNEWIGWIGGVSVIAIEFLFLTSKL